MSATFEELYARNFRFVWSLVGLLGVHDAAQEDVTQEAWTLIHRKRHRLRPDASERAWVGALTRGVVRRHLRTARRESRKRSEWAATRVAWCLASAEQVEARHTVERVLSKMNPDQRLAFALVYAHGLSAPEVATLTSVSMNTVYSRVRLAKRFIRRAGIVGDISPRALVGALRSDDPGARRRIAAALGFALPNTPAVAFVANVWASASVAALAVVVVGAVVPPAAPLRVAEAAPTRRVVEPARAPRGALESKATPTPSAAPPSPPPLPPAVLDPQRPKQTAAVQPGTKRLKPAPRLGEEVRLLDDANRALRRGDAKTALALVGRHAREFSDGSLADVREAVRVRALCAAGRTDAARRNAEVLAAARPDSSVWASARRACDSK